MPIEHLQPTYENVLGKGKPLPKRENFKIYFLLLRPIENINLNSPYSHKNSERTPKVTYFIKWIGSPLFIRPGIADTIIIRKVNINIFLL